MRKFVVVALLLVSLLVTPSFASEIASDYKAMCTYGEQGNLLYAYMTAQKIVNKLEQQPELLCDLNPQFDDIFDIMIYSTAKLYLDAMYISQGYTNITSASSLNDYVWGARYDKNNTKDSQKYLKFMGAVSLNKKSSEATDFIDYGKFLRGLHNKLYEFKKFDYPNYYRPHTYKPEWAVWRGKEYKNKRAAFNSTLQNYLERLYYNFGSSHNDWQKSVNAYAKDRIAIVTAEAKLISVVDSLFNADTITAKQQQHLKNAINTACTWGKALDEEIAYYLFDCPINAMSWMLLHVLHGDSKFFSSAKTEQLKECGRYYSALTGDIIEYAVLQSTREGWVFVAEGLKKNLSAKEYEALKTRASFQINAVQGIDQRQMTRWP